MRAKNHTLITHPKRSRIRQKVSNRIELGVTPMTLVSESQTSMLGSRFRDQKYSARSALSTHPEAQFRGPKILLNIQEVRIRHQRHSQVEPIEHSASDLYPGLVAHPNFIRPVDPSIPLKALAVVDPVIKEDHCALTRSLRYI